MGGTSSVLERLSLCKSAGSHYAGLVKKLWAPLSSSGTWGIVTWSALPLVVPYQQSLPVGQTFGFGMAVVRGLQCLMALSLRQVLEVLVPCFSFPCCYRVLHQSAQWGCGFTGAIVQLEMLSHLHLAKSSKGFTVPMPGVLPTSKVNNHE